MPKLKTHRGAAKRFKKLRREVLAARRSSAHPDEKSRSGSAA